MPVFWRFGIHLLGELCDSGGGSFALGDAMAKPRDDRQKDLLRPALEAIIDLGHPLVRLARAVDWRFLDQRVARAWTAGAGEAPPATPPVARPFLFTQHDGSVGHG